MTKLCYDGVHWTPHNNVFMARGHRHGPLAVWQGQNFGGSSAYALLGPDIERPGGRTNLPPAALGPGWNQNWNHAPPGPGPAFPFTLDAANTWYRGHLINGEWGGSGANWANLTPLTTQANANHRTVENRLRIYLQNFRAFNEMFNGHQGYWYALQYWVEVSTDPWAAAPVAAGNLYAYCPNMIRVTWRVVTIAKPVGGIGGTGFAALAGAGNAIDITPPFYPLGGAIGWDMPNIHPHTIPAVLSFNPANLADAGGPVHPLPPGAPAIPLATSNYDGRVEIFQD